MSIINIIISNFHNILLGIAWLSITVTIIAFVHEFGHYIVAKWCGVKIEAFAIGMGKAIFTWKRKNGELWKICMFPIGGYVKMLGQSDIPKDTFEYIGEDERKQSFEFKNPYQRIAISFAGPFANFLLTLFVVIALLIINGKDIALPKISKIEPNSPAYKAKLQVNDEILAVNGKKISDFFDVRRIIMKSNCQIMNLEVLRKNNKKDKIFNINVQPEKMDTLDHFGNKINACILGIFASEVMHQEFSFKNGLIEGSKDTIRMTRDTMYGIFQLLTGQKKLKELSGPLRIGKFSHQAANLGFAAFFYLVAIISIGVGVMNLVPIPVLDGGHILMNLIAIIIRRDVPVKIQYIIYQVGFALVISLMLIGFVNDFKFLIKL